MKCKNAQINCSLGEAGCDQTVSKNIISITSQSSRAVVHKPPHYKDKCIFEDLQSAAKYERHCSTEM